MRKYDAKIESSMKLFYGLLNENEGRLYAAVEAKKMKKIRNQLKILF